MCGFVGCFEIDAQKTDTEALRTEILDMSRKIRHRGPDWSGVYTSDRAILSHERLAIVDPFSGKQPLFSDDGKIILIVNGEIYNHQEIRKEFEGTYSFRTKSDCEVIIPLYRKYGTDFLEKLSGIFAFALYDFIHVHGRICPQEIFMFAERMAGHIKPEEVLFIAEDLRFGKFGDIRRRHIPESGLFKIVQHVEQTALTDFLVVTPGIGGGYRRFDNGYQLGAFQTERIHGTGPDEVFHCFGIQDAASALQQITQTLEVAIFFPGLDDAFRSTLPEALDRAQAKTY